MGKQAFGTEYIAKICQVTRPTVGRWIEEGKLPSFRTGGGHRRVWGDDLVRFLDELNIPVPPELRAGAAPLRILVVDDEEKMRAVIQRTLRQYYPDAELFEAGDGFEAGRKVGQLAPALVILDLRLPGMDGYKVCQSIRKDPDLRRVRILAISGDPTEGAGGRALEEGADAFLAKPFLPEELVRSLEALMRSGASRGPGGA